MLTQAAAHSRYLCRLLQAHPDLASGIGQTLDRPLTRQDMDDWLSATPLDEESLPDRLRWLRRRVYAQLIARDLGGAAPLGEVTATMTALAEVSVSTAQRVLTESFRERFGLPRNAAGEQIELIVVGMGKLGGGELNVSSDIDLIFLYAEDGETDGPRRLSCFDYFTRLGRALIQVLSEVTGEGFVFRVDMRLRPNGDSGPLVASFDMLENYFISQGREWERYAWIKARPLTGAQDAALAAISRPFVFRKYLDFGAINAMRGLHAQIRREVARREMAENIKLGPGGIREIEFIAQVFQLIRGGRDPALQIRPTCEVLKVLAARGLMPAETAAELTAAYVFLRRLEHRIQYIEDAQTHSLPATPEDRLSVAQTMGFDSEARLMAALDAHRALVSRHFEEVFSDPAAGEHALDSVWSGAGEADPTRDCLQGLGYREAAATAERLQAFRQGVRYRNLSEDARSRVDALMPRVLELCSARDNPDESLVRALNLLDAICRRAAYLALLQQYPATLQRVIELLSASSWAADYLARHPLLLDELLDARLLDLAPDWPGFQADLHHALEALGDDMERQMDLMREAHHAQVFRLLNQDLAGHLSVERLSDHLSALADVMLAETVHQCWQRLPRRHRENPRFAVIGYGKLGGKELGYASDLDLVFVFDEADLEIDQDAQAIYARLAQRISTWLSSRTPAGLLFETDLRLRPNGDAGLLANTLAGFEQYQRQSAWVWEHQALTRARFCAGDAEVGARFERLRHDLLCQPRDAEKLRGEVLAMRHKMYEAHANKQSGFQLKHDPGGLIDVEFVIQYLVLAHAHQWPELAGNIGNIALLKLAGTVDLIPAEVARAAADAYRALRQAQHTLRLNQQEKLVVTHGLAEAREAVQAVWRCVFGATR